MGAVALVAVLGIVATVSAAGGFDEWGYNYQARVFSGPADGVDRVLGNDPVYGNDHLVMKWSKAWDDARFHGAPWTPDAWVNNEWNGNVPDGSGESEIVKIVWIGACTEGELQPDGGYCIWGQFEAVMDHYVGADSYWLAHALPNGYGGN